MTAVDWKFEWATSDIQCIGCGAILASAADTTEAVFLARSRLATLTGGLHWTDEKADDIAYEFAVYVIHKHLREHHRFSRARALWYYQALRAYTLAVLARE